MAHAESAGAGTSDPDTVTLSPAVTERGLTCKVGGAWTPSVVPPRAARSGR